jgi:hypothetical protein
VNDYPSYERVCGAQAAVGWCLEGLKNSGEAPKEAVNPLIEEAYKAVLDNYPDCYIVDYAAYRLGELSVEKGDKTAAIAYYQKFLELAKPGNLLIETVKQKIAELEGTNK